MSNWKRLAAIASAWVLWSAGQSPADEGDLSPRLRVPEGFVIEKVAGPPDVVYPMFAAFDDRGRLFVTESSGGDLWADCNNLVRSSRIRLLEDRDGDGRFETSRVFADGLVPSMGLAWRQGRLYAADPPNVVALEETGDPREPVRRTVVAGDFGHRINSGPHGLIFGPDGRLYLGTGGSNSYRVKKRDGTVAAGQSGALFRLRPDGSEIDVLARGFGNLVEIAFLPTGEMIGTDTWFIRPPHELRDALVHVAEGGQYPCYTDGGSPSFSSGELLPAISLYPAVAPSGLAVYRGQAFPEGMRGNLFSAQFSSRKVLRHVLSRAGSTFTSREEDFVATDDPDFHPTDILEAGDGSLLVLDTGSWYVHHCPAGRIRPSPSKGGIYRVRHMKSKPIEDPWGVRIDWARRAVENVVGFLQDARPTVRDRAQEELVSRGADAVPALDGCLESSSDPESKGLALWVLGRMTCDASLDLLKREVHGSVPDRVAIAARALGVRRDGRAKEALLRLIDPGVAPHVQTAGAEALARCGGPDSVPALWGALAGEPDRLLEHALLYAVHQLVDARSLEGALKHPHPRVQKVALALLDQPSREGPAAGAVVERVAAADPDLRQTALRILKKHPEWAKDAASILRGWLEKPGLTEEEGHGLRSLVLAFRRDARVQDLVGKALEKGGPNERRMLLLETLAAGALSELPRTWKDGILRALRDSHPAVRHRAVETAAVLDPHFFGDDLTRLAEGATEPPELRVAALRAVVVRRPALSAATGDFLFGQLSQESDPVSRLAAAEILRRSRLTDVHLLKAFHVLRGDTLIGPDLLLPAFHESTGAEAGKRLLDELIDRARQGWRPKEKDVAGFLDRLPSDVREGGRPLLEIVRHGKDGDRARLKAFEPLLEGGDSKRGREVFSGRKVACSSCHRVGNEGGRVGPDLSRVGAFRSGPDLLEAIVLPSASFAQGYEPYLVATQDGRVLNGLVARQSGESAVLRDPSGGEVLLRKSQIREMKRSETSVMPEGLERALTAEEFRDLLAFLKSLR